VSDLDLAAIDARVRALVSPPWVLYGNTIWPSTKSQMEAFDADPELYDEDAWPAPIHGSDFDEDLGEFLAHARTDVPALIDEVRKLRAMVQRVRELNDDPTFAWPGYIRRDEVSKALVDQCSHTEGDAECWHFGDRDGRDG
jgi:hypothetical protein